MTSTEKDLIDEIFEELDLVDEIELDEKDEIIYSSEMVKLIQSQIVKEIAKIPIGTIISKVMERHVSKMEEKGSKLNDSVDKQLSEIKKDTSSKLDEIKKSQEEFIEKMKKSYADFRNSAESQIAPQYAFGGYPPPGGAPSFELEGWRFIVVGENLSVQKLESGVWVEKGQFNP